jgi:hypothetical protein
MTISKEFEKLAKNTVMAATSRDELLYMQRLMKERDRSLQYSAARAFKKGDYVQFKSSKTGVMIAAVVEKINQKTVDLSSVTHGKWRVSPGMLSLIKSESQAA